MPPPAHRPKRKKLNLALQGGGAHGAFTWGVLDHLLDDERLEIDGISGTSAGAINAVMLADGLARGGVDGAKRCLADFWRAASLDGNLPDVQRAVVERLFTIVPFEGSPMQAWFETLSRFFSPYDINPLNINPLRDLIERFVDFDALRAANTHPLFVSATNVRTGRLRIFQRAKITVDVVMASACLPFLFRAVEIDGIPHWDGGFMGNPAIFPFFRATDTEDVMIVQINPLERNATPTSSAEIMNRVNEITFNSSLLAEYRAIEFVTRLIDQKRLPRGTGAGEYRRFGRKRARSGPDASPVMTGYGWAWHYLAVETARHCGGIRIPFARPYANTAIEFANLPIMAPTRQAVEYPPRMRGARNPVTDLRLVAIAPRIIDR
ncbi:MAG: patatin-like phospholipase family protein [Proteobacteria bacterium]|nr:patatin-like phospholipase family protein [Pseudomonadota bacterium]